MKRVIGWMAGAGVVAIAAAVARAGDPVPDADRAVLAADVARLADADPARRDVAEFALQTVPSVDIPAVIAAAADPAALPATADADARRRLNAVPAFLTPRLAPRQRREAAAAERDAYLATTGAREYRDVRGRDPRWDADAGTAVALMCRTPVGVADVEHLTADRRRAVGAALANGCEVPVFLLHAARCADEAGGVVVDANGRPHTAADLWQRAYAGRSADAAPYHRWLAACHVLTGTATGAYDAGPRQDRQAFAALAAAAFDGYDRTADAPPAVKVAMAAGLLDAIEALNQHGMALFHFEENQFDPLCEHLSELFPTDPGIDVLRGRVAADQARRLQNGHDADGARQQRAAAATLLGKAYAADPARPGAAAAMLNAATDLGLNSAAADLWRGRATAADPDDADVWRAEVAYLDPKRHQPKTDAVAFGRRCMDRGDWPAREPLALVEAHRAAAAAAVDPAAYYKQPAVWQDVGTVYDGYFRRYPADVAELSRYADLASKCGKYAAAAAAFKTLGETVDLRPFSSAEAMRAIRADANFQAKHGR